MSDLLGYSVVPQRLVENQLLTGHMFNTTNVIKTGNGVNGVPAFIPVDVRRGGEMTEVCWGQEPGPDPLPLSRIPSTAAQFKLQLQSTNSLAQKGLSRAMGLALLLAVHHHCLLVLAVGC